MKNVVFALALFAVACSEDKPKSVDQWKMTEKTTYYTVLNEVGRPDSMYLTKSKIVNNEVKDSLQQVWVFSYPNKNDVTKRLLEKITDGSYKLISTEDQISDDKFEASKTVVKNEKGELIKEQTMVHDSLHRIVSLKEINAYFNKDLSKLYDTVLVEYTHDKDGKVISAIAKNGRGQIVRRDINLYSGSNPLQSISLSQAGDTIRKTIFTNEKGMVISSYETDSLRFKTWSKDGFILTQLATSKFSDKKFRKVVTYANNRVNAEILYRTEK